MLVAAGREILFVDVFDVDELLGGTEVIEVIRLGVAILTVVVAPHTPQYLEQY